MNKILHGLDGSQSSLKALEEAIKLAKLYRAELHTISVEEIPRFSETIDEIDEEKELEDSKFKEIINQAQTMAAAHGLKIDCHIQVGHEVKNIIEFIKKNNINLLVIGFMGNSAIYERVMGSTCQTLVRMAPCSVLVVK
ncbi:MAG: universal stress protein [Firmicutes bacterium]|nr:universal stress protein [Bacillota bacterium]